MFDDLKATFYHNVVASYDEYVSQRDAPSSGRNAHLRTAIAAASALFHFREHLPETIQPRVEDISNQCPSYELMRGVTNAAKHHSVTKYAPLVASAKDVSEFTIIVRYCDEIGEYSHAQSVVSVLCTDGTTRRLDIEITNVFNFWGNLLASHDVCSFTKRPLPVWPGSRFVVREEATMQFNLEALHDLDFRQSFQFLQFDPEKGCAFPIDLAGAEVGMHIYAAPRQTLDVTMSHPDVGDISVSLEFSDTENDEFHRLSSDLEKQIFKQAFFEKHRPEFEKLVNDEINRQAVDRSGT